MMRTKHKMTDEEFLAKFESGEIEVRPGHHDRASVAEVRAFELLRREYEDAILGAVRLTRQRGVSWSEIADALGASDAETIASYRDRIGVEAEEAGMPAKPDDPTETRMIQAMVKFRDDAVAKLEAAVARAREAGVSQDFIDLAIDWTDDEARVRWPFRR